MVPPAVIPGPAHEHVAPGVVDEPARFTEVVVQVNVCGNPPLAVGGVIFWNTVTVSVTEHDPEVTVKVYTPGVFTLMVGVVTDETPPGPDQLYAGVGEPDEPTRFTLVVVHVRV